MWNSCNSFSLFRWTFVIFEIHDFYQWLLHEIWAPFDHWSKKKYLGSQLLRSNREPVMATEPENSSTLVLAIWQGVIIAADRVLKHRLLNRQHCQAAKPSWIPLWKDIKICLNLPPVQLRLLDTEPDRSIFMLTKCRKRPRLQSPLLVTVSNKDLRIGLM